MSEALDEFRGENPGLQGRDLILALLKEINKRKMTNEKNEENELNESRKRFS